MMAYHVWKEKQYTHDGDEESQPGRGGGGLASSFDAHEISGRVKELLGLIGALSRTAKDFIAKLVSHHA